MYFTILGYSVATGKFSVQSAAGLSVFPMDQSSPRVPVLYSLIPHFDFICVTEQMHGNVESVR